MSRERVNNQVNGVINKVYMAVGTVAGIGLLVLGDVLYALLAFAAVALLFFLDRRRQTRANAPENTPNPRY